MKGVRVRRRLLLDALYTFESAARNESFAEAAVELAVTSSGVSHQIKRLEESLGVQLFDRSSKYPKLTKAGKRLSSLLHPLFGQLHSAVDEIQDSPSTNLAISVMSAFGSTWLASRAPRFSMAHPEINVRISTTDDLIDLHTENVDIGIRFGGGVYPGLVSELLLRVEVFPVCSPSFLADHPDHIASPANLLNSALINDESSSRSSSLPNWRTWFEGMAVDAEKIRYAITFQDPKMAQEAAVAGHGFAMGMSCLVESDMAAGKLVAPFPNALKSTFSFWLVYSESRTRVDKIRLFRDWILREASLPTRPA